MGICGGIPFLFHVHRQSVINLKNTSKNGTGFCSGFLPWGRQDNIVVWSPDPVSDPCPDSWRMTTDIPNTLI